MVELTVTQKVQEALVAGLNKRFDGEAYIGALYAPKFIIDFYAYDKTVVTSEMLQEYIGDFSATDDNNDYTVEIVTIPDTSYKYQFVIEVEDADN